MNRKGLLVVVSAPSGTGKGTLLSRLEKVNSNVRFSVSVTTRSPRENEIEGHDYFFKTVEEFKVMAESGELLEWVEYCDNFYGTPRKYIEELLFEGFDVVLEIEVEGAMNIRKFYPDCVLVFVLPPSPEELKKRITGRGTEHPEVIEKRIEIARKEIRFVDRYDYVIVNNEIQKAVDDINSILRSERLKCERNTSILKELGF